MCFDTILTNMNLSSKIHTTIVSQEFTSFATEEDSMDFSLIKRHQNGICWISPFLCLMRRTF